MNLTTIENCFAELDGENVPVKKGFYGDLYVKYRYRYRLVQVDELGNTFIEAPGVTAYIPITGLQKDGVSERYFKITSPY
jgi:hypothetical protein